MTLPPIDFVNIGQVTDLSLRRKQTHSSFGKRGLSFFELAMVISIIAVFSSIAMPAANNFFGGDSLSVAASTLTTDVRVARYNAMQNQTYIRLMFASDQTGWKVQQAIDSGTEEPIEGELNPAVFTVAVINDYDDISNWETILDDELHEIDPDIDIQFTPGVPPTIMFRPDGTLAQGPGFLSKPIGSVEARFMHEESSLSVWITPSGALESLEYYDENYE